ncbi:MAG: citrate/2-methylcitrate synthase [Clostridiales bacterium]|nr:citrate/2-methylcitrate synthase [Clostridiales bacterium]
MPKNYISPISMDALSSLCSELDKNNSIRPSVFEKYHVKRGLRNEDSTGVMAGLTRICSVEGYYILDGERIPKDGKLLYRGYDINDIVKGCIKDSRFGYEEVVWLLLFGSLPTANQLLSLREVLAECRALPEEFVEDVIMKNASKDIMNKMARCVLTLYSFDENPDDTSIPNVLRQSLQLIAQMPTIMSSAYQVKRRSFYDKSMFLHPIRKEHSTAECILYQLRADKKFTEEEARLLDMCLMLHADHGGGNNSTFSTRVLTSSGTDTYSAIAASFGSLKGPRHGGANLRVANQMKEIMECVPDSTDPSQVKDYLVKILNKEAGDGSGLIYGMGHAVYTKSDPRALILKESAKKLAYEKGYEKEFKTLNNIEKMTPQVFAEVKDVNKTMCANVDLYSGLVYKVLGIPEDLYTSLFAISRIAGWCAHRLEEITSGGKIMRPAYKSVSKVQKYKYLSER